VKTRPYHHGDLRAALLSQAERTLRDKGPSVLSLRELARDVGVSHAAPSRHFKDKQALLDALVLEGFDRLEAALTTARDEAGDSYADRLAAIARAYVRFAIGNAALLDLMYSFKHDPAASEALIAAVQRLSAFSAELIGDGQHRGEVREGPVECIALPVMASLHGFATLAMTFTLPAEEVERGLDETIAFVLRGCSA
jgi:AcrR family transcriptional regulator